MHAARDFDPATVRARGGHYINLVWHGSEGDIQVRRPSDNQPYGQIPDAGAQGVDQALRAAPNALNRPATNYYSLHEASTTHKVHAKGAVRQKVPSHRPRL